MSTNADADRESARKRRLRENARRRLAAAAPRPPPKVAVLASPGTTCPTCGRVQTGEAGPESITRRLRGGMNVCGVDIRLPFAAFVSLVAPDDAAHYLAEIAADVALEQHDNSRPPRRDSYRCPCGREWPVEDGA